MGFWPAGFHHKLIHKNFVTFLTEFLLLSEFCDDLLEGILPGIHLDHPDTRDDLIHDPHTLVRHAC